MSLLYTPSEIAAQAPPPFLLLPLPMSLLYTPSEIAAQAPDRQRARRKTRARGEGDEPARGPNAIMARLADVKVRPRPAPTAYNYF